MLVYHFFIICLQQICDATYFTSVCNVKILIRTLPVVHFKKRKKEVAHNQQNDYI
ncbi:hypothetical protein EZS27_008880 [termite gut metagenome]|uniref:Uncharacterized protein n=1 Tax=termite gut metagenome TaxID=433724 RepID=A0A5J4SDN0_9ZZZZ